MIFKNQTGLVKRLAGIIKMQALNNTNKEALEITSDMYQALGEIYVQSAPLQRTQELGQKEYNLGRAYWKAGYELGRGLRRC